jgi:hypothetical protein
LPTRPRQDGPQTRLGRGAADARPNLGGMEDGGMDGRGPCRSTARLRRRRGYGSTSGYGGYPLRTIPGTRRDPAAILLRPCFDIALRVLHGRSCQRPLDGLASLGAAGDRQGSLRGSGEYRPVRRRHQQTRTYRHSQSSSAIRPSRPRSCRAIHNDSEWRAPHTNSTGQTSSSSNRSIQ